MLKIKAVLKAKNVIPHKQMMNLTIKPRICIKVNTIHFVFMLTLVPFKEVNLQGTVLFI